MQHLQCKNFHLSIAETINPVRSPIPLSEETAGLLLSPDPALVSCLHGFKGLLYSLLEAVVPELVDVLLQEIVDLIAPMSVSSPSRFPVA